MTIALPNKAELDTAVAIVYAAMPPTPQYSWPLLNEALGTEVWVKHENHTPTGAFKVRGGLVYIHELVQRSPEVKGVISATRGNHGQSVGFAVRRHGLQATIVVPKHNSKEKCRDARARRASDRTWRRIPGQPGTCGPACGQPRAAHDSVDAPRPGARRGDLLG
ncbi:pyridoxal-phosphate dependent enzyme [Undibacterium arcticum]